MRLYTLRPHHRRRHRKKLHLAEFAEHGFAVHGQAPAAWGGIDPDPLLAFIDDQGWCWEGERAPLDGFVARFGGGSLSELDRTRLCDWLAGQGASDVRVGPLVDRWGWITG